jgi:hypothetical protein
VGKQYAPGFAYLCGKDLRKARALANAVSELLAVGDKSTASLFGSQDALLGIVWRLTAKRVAISISGGMRVPFASFPAEISPLI